MNWPMSGEFPSPGRNPHVNALNLGDYEFDLTGQEVHSDGEIWIATNYTLRQLFLNRYPGTRFLARSQVRDRPGPRDPVSG